RQRRTIGNFERDKAFPLRLEGGDVDDDAAARVRRLAYADREHVARNLEVFDGAGESERVGWNQDGRTLDVNERSLIEVLGIDDGGVDVGEDFEFIGHTQIVTVGRKTVGDHAVADLAVVERIDHVVVESHFADPAVAFNRHGYGVLGYSGIVFARKDECAILIGSNLR